MQDNRFFTCDLFLRAPKAAELPDRLMKCRGPEAGERRRARRDAPMFTTGAATPLSSVCRSALHRKHPPPRRPGNSRRICDPAKIFLTFPVTAVVRSGKRFSLVLVVDKLKPLTRYFRKGKFFILALLRSAQPERLCKVFN